MGGILEQAPTLEPSPEWQHAYERVVNGNNERGIMYRNGNNGMPSDHYEVEHYTFSLVDFDDNGVPERVKTMLTQSIG